MQKARDHETKSIYIKNRRPQKDSHPVRKTYGFPVDLTDSSDRVFHMERRKSLQPATSFGELPPTVSKSAICALEQARRANVSTYQVCYLTPRSHGSIEANVREKIKDFQGFPLICVNFCMFFILKMSQKSRKLKLF